jgi:hypothetical protein
MIRGNAFHVIRKGIQLCVLGFVLMLSTSAQGQQVFDMRAISDPSTLEIEVVQPWQTVNGPVVTRQKLVTINVGQIWAGQNYRVSVRMVVPANRRAQGFHLTGGNSPMSLQRDVRPRGANLELLKGGVGLVMTVVQDPGSYGQVELGGAAEARFAKTLNPHYKIQYWAWPATLMRAITAAYAETDHFEEGKVAVTGSSKNGASPSMAIIHDERMTALHATVSPIWDSPLRLCDRKAWNRHLAEGGQQRGFSGGHFGPNFNQHALNAGHTWEDLQGFAEDISDQVFISRNIKDLRSRGVEMLFHPGTHDMVAYDMAWGGANHPSIPVYLGSNSGHGKKGHPKIERDQQNRTALLLRHFFPDECRESLLSPPAIETEVENDVMRVTVRFPPNAGEETGRIWWIYDRGPDGSPRYLQELIPDENSKQMTHDSKQGVWTTEIKLDSSASRIDIFSNHRKMIKYRELSYPTYISSPYTRVELSDSK